MSDKVDYRELGFRCGLEIHQQLDTERKLFCHCPVGLQDVAPDARIVRHMRPTLSEMGGYDPTALMEFRTRKHVVYELYRDSTCTYEMDDTPPFPINQEAVDIALEIAMLFNCNLVDEIHVSRKQYLDGSIPTGFQRTAVVGVDGWMPFPGVVDGKAGKDRLRILQVNVEEDSCREVSDRGHLIHWKTDRLSTPLVEIITDAELRSPAEAARAATEIARVMRATRRVRRGAGAARQDVNVSINGSTRVEIKGVPSINSIPKLTHFEAVRQEALLKLKTWLENRTTAPAAAGKTAASGRCATTILCSDWQAADAVETADNLGIRPAVGAMPESLAHRLRKQLGARMNDDDAVGAVALKGLHGIFGFALVGSRHFYHEVADRLRVVACLEAKPPLLVSEMAMAAASAGLDAEGWQTLMKGLDAGERDAVALVWGPKADVVTAIEEIVGRVNEAYVGVSSETRQVLADGTTGFERLLPGPERMYPDTDSPPTVVTAQRRARLKERLPASPHVVEEGLKSGGLTARQARLLADSPYHSLYATYADQAQRLDWNLAYFLGELLPAWCRRRRFEFSLKQTDQVLQGLVAGNYTVEALPTIFARIAKRRGRGCAVDRLWPPRKTADLHEVVEQALKRNGELRKKDDPRAQLDFTMGIIMRDWRGYLRGREVAEQVRSRLQTP